MDVTQSQRTILRRARLRRRAAFSSTLGAALLAACGGSQAAPFDRQFIDMMVPHHESAIDAANAAETRTQKQEIKDLAKAITADQQREIEQMRQWRRAWFG